MEALSAQMTLTSASIESLLQILSLVCGLLAVARVVQLGLVRTYPCFFSFLCIPAVLQVVVVSYGYRSLVFFWAWASLEPLRMISYILVVWELFSAVFRNYAGLRSLSRWVMGLAAVFAPIGLILTVFAPDSSILPKAKSFRLVRFERGITFGLVIFIVILLYFISKYPIKLPRNLVVLCMLYSVWFLGDSALLLSLSFLPESSLDRVNDGLALFEIASYVGWAGLLSKAGEYQETRVRSHISIERERILIGELNAMNEVLLRAGRSISHSNSGAD
jgi:hypothetical protein